MNAKERDLYLRSNTEEFLKSCKCENFKSSGPGGQRKNKVSTAVRLTHLPTGITVYATESRHRRENLLKAVKKLKMSIALNLRTDEFEIENEIRNFDFNISVGNPLYPFFIAKILDILFAHNYSFKDAASVLNLSTSQLIKLLKKDKCVWQKILSENSNRKNHKFERN